MAIGGIGSTLAEFVVKVKADTKELTTGLANGEKSARSFAQKYSTQMRIAGAAMAGLSAGIMAFGLKSALSMQEMEASIARGTGATGKTLEGLKDSFREVAGSVAFTPKSRLEKPVISLARAMAAATPMTTPAPASVIPCLTTSRSTSEVCAPRARRTPISRLRCSTAYDITP